MVHLHPFIQSCPLSRPCPHPPQNRHPTLEAERFDQNLTTTVEEGLTVLRAVGETRGKALKERGKAESEERDERSGGESLDVWTGRLRGSEPLGDTLRDSVGGMTLSLDVPDASLVEEEDVGEEEEEEEGGLLLLLDAARCPRSCSCGFASSFSHTACTDQRAPRRDSSSGALTPRGLCNSLNVRSASAGIIFTPRRRGEGVEGRGPRGDVGGAWNDLSLSECRWNALLGNTPHTTNTSTTSTTTPPPSPPSLSIFHLPPQLTGTGRPSQGIIHPVRWLSVSDRGRLSPIGPPPRQPPPFTPPPSSPPSPSGLIYYVNRWGCRQQRRSQPCLHPGAGSFPSGCSVPAVCAAVKYCFPKLRPVGKSVVAKQSAPTLASGFPSSSSRVKRQRGEGTLLRSCEPLSRWLGPAGNQTWSDASCWCQRLDPGNKLSEALCQYETLATTMGSASNYTVDRHQHKGAERGPPPFSHTLKNESYIQPLSMATVLPSMGAEVLMKTRRKGLLSGCQREFMFIRWAPRLLDGTCMYAEKPRVTGQLSAIYWLKPVLSQKWSDVWHQSITFVNFEEVLSSNKEPNTLNPIRPHYYSTRSPEVSRPGLNSHFTPIKHTIKI
ncbi:hypothetical protein INR49_024124 [Caranx melampygus]|nr:hypothetical protein INR49_024124 [Caranx melampygus]